MYVKKNDRYESYYEKRRNYADIQKHARDSRNTTKIPAENRELLSKMENILII